ATYYKGVKINIVDTPGHADFGGEVERVLKMVNGVILLVDSFEGPMPQTRFVLQKALELNHRVIVVVNKMDRPDARLNEVGDEVLELLMDLDATEEQLDSPIIYCSGREGTATLDPNAKGENLNPLFDLIVSYIPAPQGNWEEPLQMLVSSIDYNEYVGRIAVGRIERGEIKQGQEVSLCDYHIEDLCTTGKVTAIYQYDGLKRIPVQSARAGDIIAFSGLDTVNIGNTICAPYTFEPIPFVKISEPTVEMTFSVNDSPFAGREGKFVTSRHLRERLLNELRKDVSLNVQETDSADKFRVLGRGEMHLSILIETMRREGYEFQVSTPKVLFKTINGQMCEPIERLLVDIPSESVGSVIEKLGARKSEMVHMTPQGDRMRIEFLIPARGLFGYRSEFMTDTRGEGILNTVFSGYEEYKGDIDKRSYGSLIAFESGDAVIYGLYNAQERGVLFIGAPTAVYAGMVVGYSPKNEDLVVNVCKKKHISNVRASGSDDSLRLTTPKTMSLEEMLEFLGDDELLEVTPKNLRIRKRILDHQLRLRSNKK
ncbi:MAG: translational GTPase TypA, partial [Christensenellaceae bacterium]